MPIETGGVAPIVVGLPMAAGLGLMFGMGPCLVSCLPFLGPVFLSMDGGVKRSLRIVAPHALGRLVGYGGLAAVVGFVGDYAGDMFGALVVNTALGSATLLTGLAILAMWRIGKQRRCGAGCATNGWEHDAVRQFLPSGLFLMGLGMAFTPCAPLTVVLFSAAASADWRTGLALGFAFGLGAIAVPALVYGVGFSYFATQLRQRLGVWLGRMELLSGGLLVTLGLATLFK
jgi:thiol:disulfide interchange protein DsbD